MATDSKKKQTVNTSGAAKGGKKMTKKQRAKRKRRRILIFIVEILVISVMLMVLWGVTKTEKVGKVNIKEEDIVINEEVQEKIETQEDYHYRNIALFGVDSTTGSLRDDTRSDTIMVASINTKTGEVKICSVYRDTYLNRGNDTYNKATTAYGMGGPEQAMNMLNMSLDLDITDFVTVGFEGLADVIDALGGIEINITDDEISHLNNYQICIAENLKRDNYTPVTHSGLQTLDGLQATAYCRIRYTKGDDFKRAERQRTVLMKVAEKARTASVSELTQIANDVFDKVYTSLDLSEIIELLGDITKYQIVGNDGFPKSDMRTTGTIGSKGSCVIPVDLEQNVIWLHEFLFEDEEYTPSNSVKEYSQKIKSDTDPYVK